METVIYIGIPSYDSKIHANTMAGLLDLRHLCTANNIGFALDVIHHNAFVGHGRNQVVQRFLKSGFRDLLFIDADIGFEAIDAAAVCKAEPSIVFGMYLMKKERPQYPALFDDPIQSHHSDPNLIKMKYGPAGFMRIRADVFKAMEAAWPDEWYHDGATQEKTFDHFPGGRHGNNFASEDIAFCDRARSLGIDLWAMQGIRLTHTGEKTWAAKWEMVKPEIVEYEQS